jgi:DDE superfamily endonuclease/Helix-turn-helix of DDE superfamily endonuclease
MQYSEISKRPKQFLALTSLEIEEFEWLLGAFSPICETYFRYRTLEGKRRKIPSSKEHGNAQLLGSEQKLFFLLLYLKTNVLQEHHAASFGVSQAKVSQFIPLLLALLDQTLQKVGLAPTRDSELLATILKDHLHSFFCYDGLERGIVRNLDKDAQEIEFSGKKKTHKIKNNLLCDENQYIHYLSPTEVGSTHDKTLADEYPLNLPAGSVLKQDLGFLGHHPPNITVEMPFKTPPKGELTFGQKVYNKLLSATRVPIEHANSGVKRLRILKETIRIHSTWFRDTVVAVACALHNFRVLSEKRNYNLGAGT